MVIEFMKSTPVYNYYKYRELGIRPISKKVEFSRVVIVKDSKFWDWNTSNPASSVRGASEGSLEVVYEDKSELEDDSDSEGESKSEGDSEGDSDEDSGSDLDSGCGLESGSQDFGVKLLE